MIIGLCGFKNSGKDTVAAYLVKEHGFERKAFADPLKRSVAALLGIPFSEVDRLKNDPEARVSLTIHQGLGQQTFREFLQRFGTESHRDVFGQDFWLDHTLPVRGFYPGRAIVVTDVRFSNEADRIRQLGGTIWYISRAQKESSDTHSSEKIDFTIDEIIDNTGTFDELYQNVEKALSLVPIA